MTRKILINGRREEELRVAIVENQTLEDFEIETKRRGVIRNNIYRAVVTNIAPSLNAAFVDFGDSRNGFLAFNDVVESVYSKPGRDSYRISDVLTIGQELIVQVIKDASALKGAQVTTNISLAGRYLVLRPRDAKSGVSHKLDDDARADLTQKIRSLDLPDGYGCIVRTNAMDQSRAILLRDAKVLVQLWHKIEAEFARGKGPQLLYNDQDIVVQAMRDYYDSSINEVIIDDKCCYERALAYVRATIASGEEKLKYYDDKMPLFTRYGIERQIEQIYARTVRLPSGGFIVIDPTEALTAIDVNSAHSTKRESQDQTAYSTNLEAAVEIGRQLRMRDIGGLIVIDFIDMRQGKYQRDVERVMRNALSRDKARCKVERISANGLLEINRQRISQALSQRTHLECPTCGGRGFIPSADAIGMTLIREIDAHAVDGKLGGVIIKLHPDIAQQLQNEMRREFAQLELDYGIRIEIVASRDVTRGAEEIEWLSKSQAEELHPERASAQSQDAASIVDVAEAYQASETEDGGYRPNDFEEFSSDEARRKRAAKRAARREAEKAAQNEARKEAENAKVEASKHEAAKADKEVAGKQDKAGKREQAEAKREQADAKQDQPDMDARDAIGISLLGMFVSEMKDRMEPSRPATEEKSGRRRPSFRARRKNNNGEKVSLQSDMRLFAMDILHAVCVLACGCDRDVSRREMLRRMDEVSDWLMDAGQQDRAECHKRVIALRNQITSRHACARMNCLFDVRGHARPDELARFLLEACRFVGTYEVTDESLASLSAWFSERVARIFGEHAEETPAVAKENENAAVAEMEEHEALEEMKQLNIDDALLDAVENLDISELEAAFHAADATLNVPEDIERANDAMDDREFGRRRRRSHRRHAMGDESNRPLVEDGEIVTADVAIAPMIVTEKDVAEEALGMAITQELPAVASRRRRSHRRSEMGEGGERIEMREDAVDSSDVVKIPVRESEAVSKNVVPEAEIAADAKEAPVRDVAKADSSLIAQLHEGGQVSKRRVRHTRRAFAEVVKQAYDVCASDVSEIAMPEEIVAAGKEMPEAEKREADVVKAEAVAAEDRADKDVASEISSGRIRRTRRTSRASIGEAQAVAERADAMPEVVGDAPVEAVAAEPMVVAEVSQAEVAEQAEVSAPSRRERRRNRRGEDKTAEREEKQSHDAEDKTAEREEKQPRDRRERAAKPKRNREEAVENAEPAVAQAPVAEVDIALMTTAELPVVAEEVRRSRRVRRTRVSAEVPVDVDAPASTPKVVEVAPVAVAEPVIEPVAEPMVAEAPKAETRAVRRTRRTRKTDVDGVNETPAPVAESKPEAVESKPAEPASPVEENASETAENGTRTRARRTRRARPEA